MALASFKVDSKLFKNLWKPENPKVIKQWVDKWVTTENSFLGFLTCVDLWHLWQKGPIYMERGVPECILLPEEIPSSYYQYSDTSIYGFSGGILPQK